MHACVHIDSPVSKHEVPVPVLHSQTLAKHAAQVNEHGKTISSKEYLENALLEVPGVSEKVVDTLFVQTRVRGWMCEGEELGKRGTAIVETESFLKQIVAQACDQRLARDGVRAKV